MPALHACIDKILLPYKSLLANDFDKYRNHVGRVYLHCLLLDSDEANAEKYAIAAVFHDIGLWTAQTFDYLAPSIAVSEDYLHHHNRQEWMDEISQMIYWHHKMTRYKGPVLTTAETFRKADWMDVTLGLMAFGISRQTLKQYRDQLPLLGFHLFLFKRAAKYFLKHPFHPLPMFK